MSSVVESGHQPVSDYRAFDGVGLGDGRRTHTQQDSGESHSQGAFPAPYDERARDPVSARAFGFPEIQMRRSFAVLEPWFISKDERHSPPTRPRPSVIIWFIEKIRYKFLKKLDKIHLSFSAAI